MSAAALAPRDPPQRAGTSCGQPTARRYVFFIEGRNEVDLLVRILTPFAVAGAKLAAVEFDVADGRAIARLQVDGLSQARAEHLCAKIGSAPAFSRVGFGWVGQPG